MLRQWGGQLPVLLWRQAGHVAIGRVPLPEGCVTTDGLRHEIGRHVFTLATVAGDEQGSWGIATVQQAGGNQGLVGRLVVAEPFDEAATAPYQRANELFLPTVLDRHARRHASF